jgi:hypothetical protein
MPSDCYQEFYQVLASGVPMQHALDRIEALKVSNFIDRSVDRVSFVAVFTNVELGTLQIVDMKARFDRTGFVQKNFHGQSYLLAYVMSPKETALQIIFALWFIYPLVGLYYTIFGKQYNTSRKQRAAKWLLKYGVFILPPMISGLYFQLNSDLSSEIAKLQQIVVDSYSSNSGISDIDNYNSFELYYPFFLEVEIEEDDVCEDRVDLLIAHFLYINRHAKAQFRPGVDATSCTSFIDAKVVPDCTNPRTLSFCPRACDACCEDKDDLLQAYVTSFSLLGGDNYDYTGLTNCTVVAETGSCPGYFSQICRKSCRTDCGAVLVPPPSAAPVPEGAELTEEERTRITNNVNLDTIMSISAFHTQLEVVNGVTADITSVQIAFTFTLTIMLLQVLHFHPNLGVITRTVIQGGSDLIFICVLFCALNLMYTIFAIQIFGSSVVDANYTDGGSVFVILFLAMLGEFDYDSLRDSEAGSANAAIFFILFVIIFNVIILNIILAIVVDAYADAKDASGDRPSVQEEMYILISHYYNMAAARMQGGSRLVKDVWGFEENLVDHAFYNPNATGTEGVVLQHLLPTHPSYLAQFMELEEYWRGLHDPDSAVAKKKDTPREMAIEPVGCGRSYSRRGSRQQSPLHNTYGTATNGDDVGKEISSLCAYFEKGLLGREEFEAAKKHLLLNQGRTAKPLKMSRTGSAYIGGVYDM